MTRTVGPATHLPADGPVAVTGEYVHRLVPDDASGWTLDARFVSDALADRYGRRSVALGSTTLPGSWIGDGSVGDGSSGRSVEGGTSVDGDRGAVVERREPAEVVVGSAAEHRSFERRVRAATPGMDADPGGAGYSGPLYVYKGGGLLSRPAPDDLRVRDRTGPINVAWRADALAAGGTDSVAWVASTMEGPGGWTSIVPNWWARERYVRLPDGPEDGSGNAGGSGDDGGSRDGRTNASATPPTARPAAAEVQRRIRRLDPFQQYHVRLYDVADADPRHPVVGQAHWDPSTHDWPIPFTDSPGRFDDSRRAVLATWRELGYGTRTTALPGFTGDHGGVDDGRFDTFDGSLGVVTADGD